jgi:hypothetical protein
MKSNALHQTLSKNKKQMMIELIGKDNVTIKRMVVVYEQPQRKKHIQGAFKYRRNRGTHEDSSVK